MQRLSCARAEPAHAMQCRTSYPSSQMHVLLYASHIQPTELGLAFVSYEGHNFSTMQVTAIIYASPVGIASLIASSICKTQDLAKTVGALAAFIGVYLTGLAVICFVVYPVVFWLCTRQSPLPVYRCLTLTPPPLPTWSLFCTSHHSSFMPPSLIPHLVLTCAVLYQLYLSPCTMLGITIAEDD